MFSKLFIDNEKVVTYLWKEPYLSLVEATDVLHGRGLDGLFETRPLEDILADIAAGWKQLQKENVTPTPAWAYNANYEL